MGKIHSRIAQRAKANQRLSQNNSVEGRLYVEFTFDGITHRREHLFNSEEMELMKRMIREHGDNAAGTVIWQAAIRNAGIFGENVLAVAAQLYSLKHYVPPPELKPTVLEQTSSKAEEVIVADYFADYLKEVTAALNEQVDIKPSTDSTPE